MLAVLVAALVAAAPNTDTVVTADGTRVQGTVVEESPANGVTIQADDGTLRRFDPGQVARIEFADGSVSTWAAPAAKAPAPPPPAAQPAPQVAPQPAPQVAPQVAPRPAGPVDTVFFLGGGRVRGTVLEESASDGVRIRLLDGNMRRYSRAEIVRIEYADGSVSRRRQVPAARPLPPERVAPAAPMMAPPSEPPPYQLRRASAPLVPVYGTIGIGGTFFGGDSFEGVEMDDEFEPQGHLSLEGGIRLSPAVALGVYADAGAGDVPSEVRRSAACEGSGLDCTGVTGRFGFLLRYTFNHSEPTSQWLSLGTGWERASVTTDDWEDDWDDDEVYTYTGREHVRLGAGIDFRSNGVLGVGFYGSVAWGEYDDIDVPGSTESIAVNEAIHTTVQVGVRLILFP